MTLRFSQIFSFYFFFLEDILLKLDFADLAL
jgi:hypothetical protein